MPSREDLIRQYAEGPAKLRQTLTRVPPEAMKWRPAPGKWSVHEIIVHCADSETNAHMRVRYLLAEKEPTIVGYDQDEWARALNYHELPLEPALATIEAVRANTAPLLRSLPEAAWKRSGHHTEYPATPYGMEKWL
ncbi:MAG: DinB family protein, partial [Gemmatimonadota bacterium]